MSDIIRLQSSLFGDFLSITPENQEIVNIYQDFIKLGLMPTVMKEFDLTKQELKNRPFFVTQDNSYLISIGSGRIDITSQDIDHMPTREDFVSHAKQYLEVLFKVIRLTVNRISYICEKEVKSINSDFDTVKEGEKYLNFNHVYNKTTTFEWSANTVSVEEWELKELKEKININITISKRELMRMTGDRLETRPIYTILQDLNTKAENNQMRFDFDHVNSFLDRSIFNSVIIEEKVLAYE